jgi:HlyD family secretion protein
MKITRRPWFLVLGALILIGALVYAFVPRAVPVDLARVARGRLTVTVNEDGRTRIKERYVVSAPTGGQLRRIELHPGEEVIAGKTLIAVIEPTEPDLIDPRTRAQLEARLHAAETQLQLAAPRVERMRATLELAQSELKRATMLSEQNALAAQELDRAREAARAAAEDLKSAEYARQIAGFELEQAKAALMHSMLNGKSRDGDWMLRVIAPVNGRVLRVFHEDAGVVAPATALLEVGDPSDLEAEIDVLSTDAVRIKAGDRVLFDHWGGDTTLVGRVRVVEPAGYLKISALGVEEQRVNVIADFVTPLTQRVALGDAFRVEARIVVWDAESTPKVPVGALFRSGTQWAVFAAREGRARLTHVTVGHTDGRETEIVDGLGVGDEVVVHPSDRVADRAKITVRTRPQTER